MFPEASFCQAVLLASDNTKDDVTQDALKKGALFSCFFLGGGGQEIKIFPGDFCTGRQT